jgi:hypothetical protein
LKAELFPAGDGVPDDAGPGIGHRSAVGADGDVAASAAEVELLGAEPGDGVRRQRVVGVRRSGEGQ